MKVTNTTNIPNETVRRVINHVCPPGVTNVRIKIADSKTHVWKGRAYGRGAGFHMSANPRVNLFISPPTRRRFVGRTDPDGANRATLTTLPVFPCFGRPYQIGQHKGRRYWMADRIEALVYGLAHELRHIWQFDTKGARRRKGMAWGSRGRASEIDTEAYALRKLREWRKL